ncbi:MAG TPA: hypothetical protein VFE65_09375 [Pseudonocardia sp.]|nr:hypothetical protein [Pseudonocardia sp.]
MGRERRALDRRPAGLVGVVVGELRIDPWVVRRRPAALAAAAVPGPVPGRRRAQGPALRILHAAVRLVRGQRRREIRIPESWPWARDLEAAFLAVFALTTPT